MQMSNVRFLCFHHIDFQKRKQVHFGNAVCPADLHILNSAVFQHFVNSLGAYAESHARFLHAHYFGIILKHRLIHFFEIHFSSFIVLYWYLRWASSTQPTLLASSFLSGDQRLIWALLTNYITSKVDTYFEHRYVPKVVFSAVEAAL